MEEIKDIFISYSRKDYLMADEKTPDPEKIVSKILTVLDKNKISYWIDKEGMYASAQYTTLIEENISKARCFLYVSSKKSNTSPNTLGEIFTAVDFGKPIIVFRADSSRFGKGIGYHLRPLDHIEYFKTGDEAFSKLVSSIKKIKSVLAEYNAICSGYKKKLSSITETMKTFGAKPAADFFTNEEVRIEYEEKIAKYHEQKEQEVASLKAELIEANQALSKVQLELQSYINTGRGGELPVLESRSAEEGDIQRGIVKLENVEFKMICVDGGTFTMGATSEMENPYSNEFPIHQVTLNSYHIGETPVTQALWKAVLGNNPSYYKGDNLPVQNVTWNDCQRFIKKLNQITGKKFRLPTDAEWEFAARGGNNSKHYQYNGSNSLSEVAWYKGNSEKECRPVKCKEPNELGIYDMSGGVWEWCQDWYGYYSHNPQINPTGPARGCFRVRRGGSWGNEARECRLSSRRGHQPDFCNSQFGFRLAITEL